MIFIPDSSDGVDGTSLKMAKVVPGDAPAPLPVHFANHGLAVSEANRGLAEVGHNSPERGAVDLVCTAERHSTISSSSKGCRVVFFIGHWPSRNGRGSMHRLHLCVSCGSLLAKDVQGCSTRKYAGWMLALSMQRSAHAHPDISSKAASSIARPYCGFMKAMMEFMKDPKQILPVRS